MVFLCSPVADWAVALEFRGFREIGSLPGRAITQGIQANQVATSLAIIRSQVAIALAAASVLVGPVTSAPYTGTPITLRNTT